MRFFCLLLFPAFAVAVEIEIPSFAKRECEVFWPKDKRCLQIPEDWSKKEAHAFETLLAAVTLTETGRKTLQPLLPFLASGKLKLETLTGKAARSLGLGPDSAGGFYLDTVIMENEVPFLAAVATLLHELTHAKEFLVDPDGEKKQAILTAYVKDPSLKEGAIEVIVRTEQRAFGAQNIFLRELIALNADFKSVIEEVVAHRYLIAYPVSHAQLRAILTHPSSFHFPEDRVDAYLRP